MCQFLEFLIRYAQTLNIDKPVASTNTNGLNSIAKLPEREEP